MNNLVIPSRRRLANWNRRQRKKHHAGEFTELGFTLLVQFDTPLDEVAREHYVLALIEQVEALGLTYGGDECSGFVTTYASGSVTMAQRDALHSWVIAYPAVTKAEVSELLDAWHDDSWFEAV
jgi:uncharacterized protein YggL (DUF469 family)